MNPSMLLHPHICWRVDKASGLSNAATRVVWIVFHWSRLSRSVPGESRGPGKGGGDELESWGGAPVMWHHVLWGLIKWEKDPIKWTKINSGHGSVNTQLKSSCCLCWGTIYSWALLKLLYMHQTHALSDRLQNSDKRNLLCIMDNAQYNVIPRKNT